MGHQPCFNLNTACDYRLIGKNLNFKLVNDISK